jgi:ribonuclease BN (tRNA processing enzyme)
MLLIPLGTASAFSAAAYGWTCNLIDRTLLIDAAPQAELQLRRLKVSADDLSCILITHLHGDHVFGFPFILAERSASAEPLTIVGPVGTAERLTLLCLFAFGSLNVERMSVTELPADSEGLLDLAGYRLRAVPVEHSVESLGYLISDYAGSRFAFSGDTGWCKGLQKLAAEADLLMTEMTFIDESETGHLTLVRDLPMLLEATPRHTKILLTHLSRPRQEYEEAVRHLSETLTEEQSRALARLELAEDLKEYQI